MCYHLPCRIWSISVKRCRQWRRKQFESGGTQNAGAKCRPKIFYVLYPLFCGALPVRERALQKIEWARPRDGVITFKSDYETCSINIPSVSKKFRHNSGLRRSTIKSAYALMRDGFQVMPFCAPPCPAISQSGGARAPPYLLVPAPLGVGIRRTEKNCKR